MRPGYVAFPSLGLMAFVGLLSACSDRILLNDYVSAPDASFQPPDSGDRKGPPPGDAACTVEYDWIRYDKNTATATIVMDRSSAAGLSFGSSTRSAAMQTALQHAMVEKGYQASIKFGFIEYPGPSSQCGTGTCCASNLLVQPSFNNYSYINNWIRCDPFSSQCPPFTSDAPLHSALFQAAESVEQSSWRANSGVQQVIVFSAGEPACAYKNNTCENILNAGSYLADQNVNLVTLAVGWLPSSTSCVQRLSQIKSWNSSLATSQLYSPQTGEELSADLETILATLGKTICTLELKETIDPSRKVVVLSDGKLLPTTGNDKWEFDQANTHIQLQGQSCDALIRGEVKEVKIAYACTSCPGSGSCFGRP